MKNKSITALSLISLLAQAQDTDISQGFKKLAPTATITATTQTPIKGISQINLDSENINDTFYMTNDGKYLINGSIIETASRKNLTEDSKTAKRKSIVDKFGDDERINFYPEDMKHHITVYTDIDCGYCRKLHNEMKEYNDAGIGISYLFWPRAGLQSSSYEKAVTAWCAVDKNKAMTQSQNGIELETKKCDNPVADHYNSGRKIGVRGTPNIVTDKGELIPTYMPAVQLLQRLELLAAQ